MTLEKYRIVFKIDEWQESNTYQEKISTFTDFLKLTDKMMERSKTDLKTMMQHCQEMHNNFTKVHTYFMKFEDLAVNYFADEDINCLNLTHPGVGEVKNEILEK